MRKFNKTVNVEMSADSVAEMFLASQHFLFEQREQFIETIVGTAMQSGTLGTIVGGFMGVLPKCELSVNTDVICSKTCYDYSTPESIEKNDTVCRNIGKATIIDTNPYAKECYQIEYWKTDLKGQQYLTQDWVSKMYVTVDSSNLDNIV